MLYLGDYLELIEHLPQELKYKLTEMRQLDLQVHNTTDQLDDQTRQFFKQCAEHGQEPATRRQQEFDRILAEYLETMKCVDEKVQMAQQMHDLVERLARRLDGELNKFKLELEADHAGITEELEARSYELDNLDSCMSPPTAMAPTSTASKRIRNFSSTASNGKAAIEARRRSYQKSASQSTSTSPRSAIDEYEYYDDDDDDGPQSMDYHPAGASHRSQRGRAKNYRGRHSLGGRQWHKTARIAGSNSGPGSIVGEPDLGNQILGALSREFASQSGTKFADRLGSGAGVTFNQQSTATSTMGSSSNNNSNNKQQSTNSSFASQHSALSAALASAPTAYHSSSGQQTSLSTTFGHHHSLPSMINGKPPMHGLSPLNGSCASSSSSSGQKELGTSLPPTTTSTTATTPFNTATASQDPIVAAASQAIAATQQMQMGRRTSSLKASYAAINSNGLGTTLSDFSKDNHHNNHHNKQQSQAQSMAGKSVPPLYISVTKSGRMSKRPRHQLNYYRDESPTLHHYHNQHLQQQQQRAQHNQYDFGASHTTSSQSSFAEHQNELSMLSTADLSDSNTIMFDSPSTPTDSPDPFAGGGANTGPSSTGAGAYQKDDTKYCICRRVSYGAMVACDNIQCELEWFHYGCVGITQPPKGKWFCPDCIKKLTLAQHKKRGRKPSYLKRESQINQQQQQQHITNIEEQAHDQIASVSVNTSAAHTNQQHQPQQQLQQTQQHQPQEINY